ncbi:alpha-1-antiproteinase F-like [Paramacrobiotus metropolitanus]|uniref:alpha-1-antiproteinase F-like n=1 Tax=Paramacrobiotus metropolitanus TaxID=2943436 RepID=UPI002445A3C8|nr:alpha-1-antiproteinase F-like [Paramacrobiotus metropolitanus]
MHRWFALYFAFEKHCKIMAIMSFPNHFENRLRFSLSLYKTISAHIPDSDNFLVSPLSEELAAVTAYIGAQGRTRSEIAEVLGLTADYKIEDISDCLAKIISDETGEIEFPPENWSKNFEFSACVGVFVDESVRLNASYTVNAQNLIKAVCVPVRFAGDPESAWENVRNFITSHTKGKVQDVPEPSKITPPNLMFATALNFQANWAAPFPEIQTGKKWFTLASGAKVQVDTLHGTFTRLCKYHESATLHGAKILQVPYMGHFFKAYFILPGQENLSSCEDGLSRLEDLLTPTLLQQEMRKLDFAHKVTIEMPKFSLQCTMAVENFLWEMGMPSAFTEDADLSGVSTLSPLKISTITQTAVFGIDENGSDPCPVAVPTDRLIFMSWIPQNTENFIAARPFLFVVCHDETGSIILMGRICNPLIA